LIALTITYTDRLKASGNSYKACLRRLGAAKSWASEVVARGRGLGPIARPPLKGMRKNKIFTDPVFASWVASSRFSSDSPLRLVLKKAEKRVNSLFILIPENGGLVFGEARGGLTADGRLGRVFGDMVGKVH